MTTTVEAISTLIMSLFQLTGITLVADNINYVIALIIMGTLYVHFYNYLYKLYCDVREFYLRYVTKVEYFLDKLENINNVNSPPLVHKPSLTDTLNQIKPYEKIPCIYEPTPNFEQNYWNKLGGGVNHPATASMDDIICGPDGTYYDTSSHDNTFNVPHDLNHKFPFPATGAIRDDVHTTKPNTHNPLIGPNAGASHLNLFPPNVTAHNPTQIMSNMNHHTIKPEINFAAVPKITTSSCQNLTIKPDNQLNNKPINDLPDEHKLDQIVNMLETYVKANISNEINKQEVCDSPVSVKSTSSTETSGTSKSSTETNESEKFNIIDNN